MDHRSLWRRSTHVECSVWCKDSDARANWTGGGKGGGGGVGVVPQGEQQTELLLSLRGPVEETRHGVVPRVPPVLVTLIPNPEP